MEKRIFGGFIFVCLLWKIWKIIFKVILETVPSECSKGLPSEFRWFPNQSHQKEILLRRNSQNASILCFPIRVKQNKLESESGSGELFAKH